MRSFASLSLANGFHWVKDCCGFGGLGDGSVHSNWGEGDVQLKFEVKVVVQLKSEVEVVYDKFHLAVIFGDLLQKSLSGCKIKISFTSHYNCSKKMSDYLFSVSGF